MMNYDLRMMNLDLGFKNGLKTTVLGFRSFRLPSSVFILYSLFFVLCSFSSSAQQITSSIDSTSIKIGAQITYRIEINSDSIPFVVFPEGQTFQPLEMIESYKIDTTKNNDKYKLIKQYGLTQFDSGVYTIPSQKIIIGGKEVFTDSLKVEVHTIVVDTTKQGLYNIKPIVAVNKSPSKWWIYLLIGLLILALVGFLLYWFIWRKKPLTEDEKVALLPPYERAKLALLELDKTEYLENKEIKEYYSELTGIIRKYLNEKVYNHSLESTTQELINRLYLLKEGHQIDLSKEDIIRINDILRRADLVKFAKSEPNIELAKMDRNVIDIEIDNVKESLPEPTEEELLEDIRYQEELAKKQKSKKIIITIVITALLLIGVFSGFIIRYGFDYVKDTLFGHDSKELLETKGWITSDYGAPSITITTPKVLERMPVELPDELKEKVKITAFGYGSFEEFNIVVSTSKFDTGKDINYEKDEANENEGKIDLRQVAEGGLKTFENKGVKNIITLSKKFITPNGLGGLKTYGTADFPTLIEDEFEKGNYILLGFIAKDILQQVIITWRDNDLYADKIVGRILNSIELIKEEEK